MNALLAWFTWRGRLRRRSYWAMAAVCGLAFVLLFVAIENLAGRGATLLLYPPLFATLLSQSIRRLHDQARGGGWLLALLVPVLGPLLLAFLLLFRRGTPGENQFGADPRLAGRDYLKVAVYESA
jgi:uncharacterized membrane protein YhaH (DUF805 family)